MAMAQPRAVVGGWPWSYGGQAPYKPCAGGGPSRATTTCIHQEPFETRRVIVRPLFEVEWDAAPGGFDEETLCRAPTASRTSDPMGPVYLMLPRETLTADL